MRIIKGVHINCHDIFDKNHLIWSLENGDQLCLPLKGSKMLLLPIGSYLFFTALPRNLIEDVRDPSVYPLLDGGVHILPVFRMAHQHGNNPTQVTQYTYNSHSP